ncbi:hypothetical protein OL239_12570 [Arthrobacter sp. ATA002]|uniref:hypothetical protein n=1 Tax=Arthrobacter sp. ATA002 TaxID=2991715 RepID=UPI0022A663F7|nr:hypothetical protein [Arthrobacter sp. ATA002]WAP50820.1 hypothetical protein OL239_12570 [Arthrobacter sp. ATA002]
MARNSLLDRFRPVGSPGPAGPAGVPAGDEEGPEAELIPVFESLDPTIRHARGRTEDASAGAAETVAQARSRAAALIEQARMDSGAVRARAAAEVAEKTGAEDALMLSNAGSEATELQERGESRIPELAAAIVAEMVADLLGDTDS